MRKELMIGCGRRMVKDMYVEDFKDFEDLVRLDINPDVSPDVLWDLRKHPLPFADNTFDEIHAYEVLEHLANQGDYEFFFDEFTEYARIVKPGGYFLGSVPAGIWVWGDPSHKRTIQEETLIFLSQTSYKQIEETKTTMSDFRNIYKADWETMSIKKGDKRMFFALRNKK